MAAAAAAAGLAFRRAAGGAQLQVSGAPVRYEVTLEPNNRPWLLVLDAAAQAARRARASKPR